MKKYKEAMFPFASIIMGISLSMLIFPILIDAKELQERIDRDNVKIHVLYSELQTEKQNFHEYNFYKELEVQNVWFKDIVFKQAKFESNYFRSNIFLKNNNPFGFRNKDWLYFENWKESITFYKQWQKKYYHGDTLSKREYLQFLIDYGYSEDDKKYGEKINQVK